MSNRHDNAAEERPDQDALRHILERLLDSVGDGGLASLDIAAIIGGADQARGRRAADIVRQLGSGDTLAKIAGLDRNELEAIYAIGRSLMGAGDVEQAHRVFQFLCMHQHLEGRYWLAFGIAQNVLERHEHALSSFTMGALVTEGDPRFPLHSAEVHLQLGNASEARSGAELAIAFGCGTEYEQVVGMRVKRILCALESLAAAENA